MNLTNSYFNNSLGGSAAFTGSSTSAVTPMTNSYFSGGASGLSTGSGGWGSSFNLGGIGSSISNGFGDFSKHFSKNKDLYNFAGGALMAGGQYMMANKTAKESKRMNDFAMSNTVREQNRQEDQEDTYAASFKNSNLNGMYGA